jgi:nicotinamidase-related amidase
MSRQALLVIDMQNDFCLPGAPLCVAGAMGCLPKVEEAVDHARRRDIPIIWVIREHHRTGCDAERFRRHLYTEGDGATVRGTEGARLVGPRLRIEEGDHVISKKRFSAFLFTHLENLLKHGLEVERVVLSGVQTPNCIRSTAFDAVALDFARVTVLRDATASASESVQNANIDDMANVGCEILTVDQWKSRE